MIVFADSETTSLAPWRETTEIAWATEQAPDDVYTLVIPHTLLRADKMSLDIQGYHQRELWAHHNWASPEEMAHFQDVVLRDATICAANAHFDMANFERLFEPTWHYRIMEFESWAAGRIGWTRPHSMSDTFEECRRRGFVIPPPDHTAAGDVRAMVAMWRALMPPILVPGDVNTFEAEDFSEFYIEDEDDAPG